MSTLQASNSNALIVDGFDVSLKDPTASPIRGQSIRFKDGDYLAFGEKIDVRDRAFVAADRIEGWQKLQKDHPPEYLMRKTGEPRPHFRILGYKTRGDVGSQNMLAGPEQTNALRDVEAPSIAEQLNDDLPAFAKK